MQNQKKTKIKTETENQEECKHCATEEQIPSFRTAFLKLGKRQGAPTLGIW